MMFSGLQLSKSMLLARRCVFSVTRTWCTVCLMKSEALGSTAHSFLNRRSFQKGCFFFLRAVCAVHSVQVLLYNSLRHPWISSPAWVRSWWVTIEFPGKTCARAGRRVHQEFFWFKKRAKKRKPIDWCQVSSNSTLEKNVRNFWNQASVLFFQDSAVALLCQSSVSRL